METQKVYGYLRVSTDKQDINNNKADILLKANELKLGNVEWIEETISGTKDWKNRELGKLMDRIKSGDVIITSEMSRFGRTISNNMEFMANAASKNVKIYFTKTDFKVDGSITSQILTFSYSLVAQVERDIISSRTKTGLQRKREQGVILGRPKGKMKLDEHLDKIKKLIDQGVKLKSIAKLYNTSSVTMTKYVKKHNLKKTN